MGANSVTAPRTPDRKRRNAGRKAAPGAAAAPVPAATGNPVIVDRQQLAQILGVHPDRLSEYTHAGMPVLHRGGLGGDAHSRRNRYDAIASSQWVRRYRPGMVDSQQERALLDKRRREEIELRMKERSRELVSRLAVEEMLSRLIVEARTAFSGLHARIASRHQLDRRIVLDIESDVRQVLDDLADGAQQTRRAMTHGQQR
jgi:phage terminase Nu1 subunit (DNA packaging protein)